MNIVPILKAQGIGSRQVESAKILMVEEVPDCKHLKEAGVVYSEQANALAEVLCKTLPGGTLDRLIAELLTRKASLFKVPLFDE